MSQSTSFDCAWMPSRANVAPAGTFTWSRALCASFVAAYAPGVLVMAVWLRGASPSTPTAMGLSEPDTRFIDPLPLPVGELKENDGAIWASAGRMAIGELTARGPFQVRRPALTSGTGARSRRRAGLARRSSTAIAKLDALSGRETP